jgi:hypothetical protein
MASRQEQRKAQVEEARKQKSKRGADGSETVDQGQMQEGHGKGKEKTKSCTH